MWAQLLLTMALKGTLVLGGAWAITLLLRRQSAAARHLVWSGAFAALLLLPLLSVCLPAVPVNLPEPLSGAVFQTSATAPTPVPALAQVQPAKPEPSMPRPQDRRPWLLLLWGIGTALSLAQLLGGVIAAARVRRAARSFAEIDLDPLTRELGIRRSVALRCTRNGSMPIASGMLRPAVLLPVDAVDWSPERRRMVLLHELAHVQRGDLPLHLLARINWSFYWWHPLAWIAWREFLKERERAADDLVLTAGARASDYAAHLLEIARTMQSPRVLAPAALAMARPSQLEGRLLAILDSNANRKAPRKLTVALAALLTVAAMAPFAALRAQDRSATLPADADATIRAAVSQKNHEMLESAAKAAEVLQQYDLARRLLDSSLDIRADLSGAQSVAYGVGLIKIGDLERSRGHYADATGFYTKAVSVLGNRPEAAPALVNLGIFASRMKDPEGAFDYFQRAQAADPAHAGTALTWMAVVRDQQKNTDDAEMLFKQAMTLEFPGSAEQALTMELYSSFLSRQHQPDEAKSMQEKATAARLALGQAVTVNRASGIRAVRMGPGMSAPMLIHKVEPQYTEEARLAKYQGTVVVSTVIGAGGTAQSMRIVRGLGLGLDEQALKAIAQWEFKPGAKDGEPIPVQATIEVNFRLL